MTNGRTQGGLIAWFARNPVAANLLMLFLLGAGVLSAFTIRKQTTPDQELNRVEISVAYPGAGPAEVESGVVVKVEDAIRDVEGIKEISAVAREGLGVVSATVYLDSDVRLVLDEVKARVDAIAAFPEEAENPVIRQVEAPAHVVFLAVHGSASEAERKSIAQEIRDEVLRLPEVTQVELLGDRDYEISIQVSEMTLRQYGLTLGEVSQAVRESSVDLPGGVIQSSSGDLLVRSQGRATTGEEFARLTLRTYPDGTRLTLGDVAHIDDGFTESREFGRFDGEPTTTLRVLAGGQQNELATAAAVREYVSQKTGLPAGVSLDVWIDRSYYLKDRLQMMNRNLLQGAVLVFVVLSVFLRTQIAWWVVVGIPVTLFGALWLMPLVPNPVTINTISLFGFIVVLGIVVDDAIVIGESVDARTRSHGHSLGSVIDGAQRVALPATFGVLTTMAAFAPMLFIGGAFGPFFEALSMVVILCLCISLIESKLILPAHLARARRRECAGDGDRRQSATALQQIQRQVQGLLNTVIHQVYRPVLETAIRYRGVTVAAFLAVFMLTVGFMLSSAVRIVMVPEVPSDFVQVELQMQPGTSTDLRDQTVETLEQALLALNADYATEHPGSLPMVSHIGVFSADDAGARLFVELPLDADRPFEADEISDLWRARVGDLPGVREMTFSGASPIGGGSSLSFRLSGGDYTQLSQAADELEVALARFDGVYEVQNSAVAGDNEIRVSLKPEAESLGLTQAALSSQVRQAFHGDEAQRIQRGNNEVKVMVRYPAEERRSLRHLQDMWVQTPLGGPVPFKTVAEVDLSQGYAAIQRLHRMPTITVSANADLDRVEPGAVISTLTRTTIPDILERYPGVEFGLEGSSQEAQILIEKLAVAFVIALFLIYTLLAIPLKSYIQPLIIMSVIPLGLIGAVFGHVVMNEALSMFSFFGVIALSGVLVNDSLILVDFINRARAEGQPVARAVIEASTRRFRAIVLTSLTTTAGLLPLLFETSVQAQFVIPMAISISFGIVFATLITLLLVPALYVLQVDWIQAIRPPTPWTHHHAPWRDCGHPRGREWRN